MASRASIRRQNEPPSHFSVLLYNTSLLGETLWINGKPSRQNIGEPQRCKLIADAIARYAQPSCIVLNEGLCHRLEQRVIDALRPHGYEHMYQDREPLVDGVPFGSENYVEGVQLLLNLIESSDNARLAKLLANQAGWLVPFVGRVGLLKATENPSDPPAQARVKGWGLIRAGAARLINGRVDVKVIQDALYQAASLQVEKLLNGYKLTRASTTILSRLPFAAPPKVTRFEGSTGVNRFARRAIVEVPIEVPAEGGGTKTVHLVGAHIPHGPVEDPKIRVARHQHIEQVAQTMARISGPKVFAADCNVLASSPAYEQLGYNEYGILAGAMKAVGLRDVYFEATGRHDPTFQGDTPWSRAWGQPEPDARLDYFFADPELATVNTSILSTVFKNLSDHHPVFARFRLQT